MNHDVDTVARRRKRKALLAGGSVLGLGTAVTLAAWTDDVWVSSSFAAGTFNVQGAVSPDGDWTTPQWEELETAGGAGALSFTVAPTAMSPGDSVYAPLLLRVGPDASDLNASITLPTAPTGPAVANAANDAFFDALELSLYNLPPGDCTATVTDAATALTGFDGTSLNTTSASILLTLDGDMTAQGVCFKVTLSPDAPTVVQGGQTGDLTWNFHAESVDPTP